MKKLFLLAASACLFAVSASAQLRYGPEIGLNINKFDYDIDGLDESTNMGLRIGAVMDICIAKNLTLQPGIYYSGKGGERDYFLNNTKFEESVNVGYIEIPLLLNYYFSAGPGRIFIGAGPTAGIGVHGKLEQTLTNNNNGVKIENDEDLDFGDEVGQIDRTDIGIMVNLGYDFDMGLFIRPFYNWGLSDLSNDTNFSVHNRTFGIGVGWWFGDDM